MDNPRPKNAPLTLKTNSNSNFIRFNFHKNKKISLFTQLMMQGCNMRINLQKTLETYEENHGKIHFKRLYVMVVEISALKIEKIKN